MADKLVTKQEQSALTIGHNGSHVYLNGFYITRNDSLSVPDTLKDTNGNVIDATELRLRSLGSLDIYNLIATEWEPVNNEILEELQNQIDAAQSGTYPAIPTTNPAVSPYVGKYSFQATVAGTYTSFSGIVVNAADVSAGKATYLESFDSGATWNKRVKTIVDTSAFTLNGGSALTTQGLEDKITKIITTTYPVSINPSPANNLQVFGNQKESLNWYFFKSSKNISKVGMFIYKNTSSGNFANGGRIQVVHKRGSTNTILLDRTISAAELLPYNTAGILGGYGNYEKVFDLTTPVDCISGDQIFTSLYIQDTYTILYTTDNALLASGEWNSVGTAISPESVYRVWYNPASSATYTTIPTQSGHNDSNPTAIKFYSRNDSTVVYNVPLSLKELYDEQAVPTNTVVLGKNLLNMTPVSSGGNYLTGWGIGVDGVLFQSAGFAIAKDIPAREGAQIIFSGVPSPRGLRFEKADGTLVQLVGTVTNGTPYIVPALATKFSMQLTINTTSQPVTVAQIQYGNIVTKYEPYSATPAVSKLNNNQIEAGFLTVPTKDYSLVVPKVLYSTVNDIGTNGYTEPVEVYAQRFLDDYANVFINGANKVLINKRANTANVDKGTLTLTVSDPSFKNTVVQIPTVSTKTTPSVAKKPMVWCYADSMGSLWPRNGIYSGVGAGAFWAVPAEISARRKVDNGGTGYDYLGIGTNVNQNTTGIYKSGTVPVKAFANAKPGWTAAAVLRWPFEMMRSTTYRQGAWDILGLTTLMGRNYNGSAADNIIIHGTIYGVNTPLVTSASYGLLVSEGVIQNLGAWTGSGPQTNAVQDWITGVAAGSTVQYQTALNEFFDIGKSGTNRLSLTKALAQYKTLADDGITRLVAGSTAGTKVESATAWDVCTPTHMHFCLGENDRLQITDRVKIANDLIEISSAIHNTHPNVFVGLSLMSIPGDMFPERNPNFKGAFSQSDHNDKAKLYREILSRFGDLDSQVLAKTFIIETYFTGTPLSNSDTLELITQADPNAGIIQLGNSGDTNHPGYWAMKSAGVVLKSWIDYTNTL